MRRTRFLLVLLSAATMSASQQALSADGDHAAKPASGAPRMSMEQGMMGGGMMGGDMMGMMHGMRGCARMGNAMLPALPPGNEALEFRMRAEMMQKIGEIALKYADKIRDGREGAK